MDDFFGAPPSAGQQAVANAFVTKFGFNPSDPAAANISPSDMQDFLDNEFADLFTSSSWSSTWSGASDKSVSSRISRSEIASTSVTANDANFRNLTQAFVMFAGLGFGNLGSGTQQVIISKARDLVANATGGITQVQSYLGVTQKRVSDSNDQIDSQINFLTKSINNLEQIDPATVTTQLADISTALQAAYSITNKLNNLTIMDYLK